MKLDNQPPAREGAGRDRRSASKQRVGHRGEDLAVAELEALGWQVLARNWRCRAGELDIIARDPTGDQPTVVFCEVKCRTGLGYGDPLESITWAKLRKLRQLAAEWLAAEEGQAATALAGQQHHRSAGVRIDAIGVTLLPGREPRLTHVRGIG